MKKIKDVSEALTSFEESAIKHSEAIDQGDYKAANRNHDKIIEAISFLKEQDSVNHLENLLNHSSVGVRGWAATYLLPVKEQLAMTVLEEISKGSGIRSLAAETTLKEWRKGNLKL